MEILSLNNEFGIDGQLEFFTGDSGFINIRINNSHAEALISTYAGQVLSWKPVTASQDILFVSDKAFFEHGKAIKGGIPICWPWFGPDPENQGRGSHGFVRNRLWLVTGTESHEDGSTAITLRVDISDIPAEIWPYQCQLEIQIEVSDRLKVTLLTSNTGNRSMPLTQALHTYFRVGDIRKVSVDGLDGLNYIDSIDEKRIKAQSGDVTISSETDRIYTGVESDMTIQDDSMQRKINIQTEGSKTAIVWNPWVDKSKSMSDFGDEEYRQMLCVETANAANDQRMLGPGDQHILSATYSV